MPRSTGRCPVTVLWTQEPSPQSKSSTHTASVPRAGAQSGSRSGQSLRQCPSAPQGSPQSGSGCGQAGPGTHSLPPPQPAGQSGSLAESAHRGPHRPSAAHGQSGSMASQSPGQRRSASHEGGSSAAITLSIHGAEDVDPRRAPRAAAAANAERGDPRDDLLATDALQPGTAGIPLADHRAVLEERVGVALHADAGGELLLEVAGPLVAVAHETHAASDIGVGERLAAVAQRLDARDLDVGALA